MEFSLVRAFLPKGQTASFQPHNVKVNGSSQTCRDQSIKQALRVNLLMSAIAQGTAQSLIHDQKDRFGPEVQGVLGKAHLVAEAKELLLRANAVNELVEDLKGRGNDKSLFPSERINLDDLSKNLSLSIEVSADMLELMRSFFVFNLHLFKPIMINEQLLRLMVKRATKEVGAHLIK
jgi:hypothetical protein